MTTRHSSPDHSRTAQRSDARTRRLKVSGWRRRAASRQVCAALLRHPRLRAARRVALYLAIGSELDVTPLIAALRRRGKAVCLPRVRADELHFHSHAPGAAVIRGAFGLLEPAPTSVRVATRCIDAVVVPLVAFDTSGGRLGQGGGYYDRSFAHRKRGSVRMPYLIGAAFSAQRMAHIDLAPWDVRVDAVAHDTLTRCFE